MADGYFEWLYELVIERGQYHKLLRRLHETEFTYTLEMDANRARDGTYLRDRYLMCVLRGCADDAYLRIIDRPCSVLEVMVALALRCEEHIMGCETYGDRTGFWFMEMLTSLGLFHHDDSRYDIYWVDKTVQRFLNRDYEPDGHGGLFIIENCKHDLREIDIWYQMCWYLKDYL